MTEPAATPAPTGPSLVFTTPYLRRAPRRIALRTRQLALPGTYQLTRVVGAAGGAVGASLVLLPIVAPTGLWVLLFAGACLGSVGGVFVTSWSPLRGESMAQWLLLFSAKRTGLVKIGGRYVRAYVGVAPLRRAAFGPTRMVAGYRDLDPAPGRVATYRPSMAEPGRPVPGADANRRRPLQPPVAMAKSARAVAVASGAKGGAISSLPHPKG